MLFEEFQYGGHTGHPGYQNGKILAILNFYVAPMHSIKFQHNLTYSLGGGFLKNFKMVPMAISE